MEEQTTQQQNKPFNLDPTKSTDTEVKRLFREITTDILKAEQYSKENLKIIFDNFKAFHREIIHENTSTIKRETFATLLTEETGLTESEVQSYLHHIQQEIQQFRQQREEHLRKVEQQ